MGGAGGGLSAFGFISAPSPVAHQSHQNKTMGGVYQSPSIAPANDAKDNYIGGDQSMSSILNTSKHSFEEVDKSEGNTQSTSKL